MHANVVQHAEQKESRTRLEVVIIAEMAREIVTTWQRRGRCSQRNAQHVAKTPKFLLNHALAGQSIAQIVIAKRIQLKDISYHLNHH